MPHASDEPCPAEGRLQDHDLFEPMWALVLQLVVGARLVPAAVAPARARHMSLEQTRLCCWWTTGWRGSNHPTIRLLCTAWTRERFSSLSAPRDLGTG